jgi:DNA-directed RNA polymerase subunit RPC12/RpoP
MVWRERVTFRYIQCPECGTLLCWINPRLPNYCPECGKHIFVHLKFGGLDGARDAWIIIKEMAATGNKEGEGQDD